MSWKNLFRRSDRIDRFFFGKEGFPNLSIRYKIVTTFVGIVMIVGSTFLGYSLGYFEGTGLIPFIPEAKAELPPEMKATTVKEVDNFLETNDVSMDEYDIGFNCVEFTLLQARNAHWEGIPAAVVRINLTGETNHMIIGFPIKDTGWLFVEPQENLVVKPRVGGDWLGEKITGLYYLKDFLWEEIK